MILEICPALSTSGAAVAVASGDDLECETFTAKLRDPRKPISPATKVTLEATTRTVDVIHMDQGDAMVAGEDLIIARHSDGYWFVLVWVCS